MTTHELILYERICRYGGCHTPFWICRHCDRGQCYCGPVCRRQARLQQRRCANRRYQQSIEARLDHRERQYAYRCRRRQTLGGVTGHTSPAPKSRASCGYVHLTTARIPAAVAAEAAPFRAARLPRRCIRCGVVGRVVAAVPTSVRRR